MKRDVLFFVMAALFAAAFVSCAGPGSKSNNIVDKVLNSEYKTITVTGDIPYREGDSQS